MTVKNGGKNMEQYRVTSENTTRNLGWFEDRKEAVKFCKKTEEAKCVFLYCGTRSILVYQKEQ